NASESRSRRRVLDPLCDLRTIREVSLPRRANNWLSLLPALQFQQATDDPGDPLPILSLARELFSAALGDRIVFRLAIVFRRPPLRSDPFPLPEPQERGIDRSLI